MTPGALARQLFTEYPACRLDHLRPANCIHGVIVPELAEMAKRSNGLLQCSEIGRSIEGRSINILKCGDGERRILLWSQMHGDESTATLALIDMFNLIVNQYNDRQWLRDMLGDVTIYAIPMLNPDGAERAQRRTAVGIDMNRDARVLATPEGLVLRNIQKRVKPTFGFNLHDQELSTVAATREVTAIALLAPALDEKRTSPMVRVRAMRVAAVIARTLGHFIDGHIAKYDDAFEPRAFGDNMQAWGTSTVLIESGHWPNDREKTFIRKLNYVAILTALRSIADGSYQDVDLDHYSNLKENGKSIYDVIVRNVLLEHATGWSHNADIGLTLDPAHNRPGGAEVVTIMDVGDLSTNVALSTIEGHRRRISSSVTAVGTILPLTELLSTLQLYYPTRSDSAGM